MDWISAAGSARESKQTETCLAHATHAAAHKDATISRDGSDFVLAQLISTRFVSKWRHFGRKLKKYAFQIKHVDVAEMGERQQLPEFTHAGSTVKKQQMFVNIV